ncbi:Acyl-CoA oxidase/dehydrogenase, central domain,Acyl-CoA dehydrogenase/oxidase, N-terminal,Acyl-CoA [Cinara cedri]|uniref:Acyl-CoA oxidase/dehydrogenase, central domain,Acyl-CoA dehydrogenase/oxidase, N-terminal,Acyl-CoA n=1 Tax=Cinara cedri TaxID=506608 RepID=A0A5E4MW45_9HEMI|nr:Acyl-CoA oxidase/dehydrogenase, central domain,Acyl-CoA dehydrogenase/oxidase, N-terminal,Acyl-CoA [Cinara cedri]
MLLFRLKIKFNFRKYSQAAAYDAAIASQIHPVVNQNLSFAKSLYIGNFVKDVFIRKRNDNIITTIPKCEPFFDISVPKEFGGLELSSASISKAYQNIGLTNFKNYIVHGNVVKCIDKFGTDDQKKKYLPQLASGEYTASFCVYEDKHGYDIQFTETEASCKDNKWFINGTKNWVENGNQANVFIVLAKTMEECNRPENNQNFFTAFLVKKSKNSGITIAKEGDRFNVTFDNVEADCILGSENEGMILYSYLFSADLLESSSATLGELKKIVKSASQHLEVHDRRSSLIRLGKINSHLYTMDCVLDFTNLIVDSFDFQNDYELILARLFINETAFNCLSLLNDIGLHKKSYKYIENSLLFEGRSNILSFVGALLGIQHAGLYMAEDVKKLRNPLLFPKYTVSHIMRIQRSLKDKPKLHHYVEKYMHPSLKKQALDLEYCLSRFQFAVQSMFINLGSDTCYFQMVLERANNIAMNLFVMSAVLHRVSHKLYSSNAKLNSTEFIYANVLCNNIRQQCSEKVTEILDAPDNVVDPHFKKLSQNCFAEKKYYFEHPLKRNII